LKDDSARAGGARVVTVGEAHNRQRLDNFLMTLLKGVPRSHVYRVTRRGEVRVNGGRAKPSHKLQAGDRVRIPPLRTAEAPERIRLPLWEARLRDAVLFEGEGLLVLNKPSGIAVHGGSGIAAGVIEVLRAQRGDDGFLELVHRLDKETSGCLMLAMRPALLKSLQAALRERRIDKHYLLLVRGLWPRARQRIEAPLANTRDGGERATVVDEQGRPAVTEFTLLEHLAGASLLRARLHTGRTHQIRAHAAWAGHPLAGDGRYGDAGFNRLLRREHGLERLFLHAESLSIPGPPPLSLRAPLPPELQAVLASLRGGEGPGRGQDADASSGAS
jgi:23S rRNA pseudouridine955/2504/2580 synthase